MIQKITILISIFILSSASIAGSLQPKKHNQRLYEVTITNITKGQTFTPQLIMTHKAGLTMFSLGEAANEALEALAEGGATQGIIDNFNQHDDTTAQVSNQLLHPGASVSMSIEAGGTATRLSLAAMLLPTNDTFMALQHKTLPRHGTRTFYLNAYDAGTEFNDEQCAHIPGPTCSGEAISAPAETDEGFVFIGNGIHGIGDLSASLYDWNNPVARVVITRIK